MPVDKRIALQTRKKTKFQRRYSSERELLRLITSSDSVNLELGEVQGWLIENICQIMGTESGSIWLSSGKGIEQSVKYAGNKKPIWSYYDEVNWKGGIVEDHIKDHLLLLENNIINNNDFNWWGKPEELHIRNILLTPMLFHEQAIGGLAVFNKHSGDFNQANRELLEFIANFIATSISTKRLIQQLKVINADLEVNHWQLQRSRNILRALFDSIPSSLYIIDRKYNLIAVNMYRANRIKTPPNTLVGRRCYEALFQQNDVCADCRVLESLFGGINTSRTKREWIGEDAPLEWEINTYPIYDETNQVVQAILLEQDVTDKRRLETNLAQSEKLAAVGQLAAGLAHEINNPLTAIIANTQLLQRELAGDEDKLELIDLISRAGARATQVVHNLLDLARKEEYIFEPLNVNNTITRAISLLQHEIVSHNINLYYEPGESLSQIMASEDHLQGVWVNLIANAIDAMEGCPMQEIHIYSQQHGNELRVVVSDSGKGIPPEKLSRIFEPFYTTKAPGRGTGLGLSLCHRVIKQHGGTIHVDSQIGSGTKFTVTLPVS